jgi:tetratricopeptide (TPR) repeat protein
LYAFFLWRERPRLSSYNTFSKYLLAFAVALATAVLSSCAPTQYPTTGGEAQPRFEATPPQAPSAARKPPKEYAPVPYMAFSLRVAEERVKRAGANFRDSDSDLYWLAGINLVRGFVYDPENRDLILVGAHEEGRVPLTLDDVVVALRARFRYNEWPLVSIDPTPDTKKTQMQHNRFEGRIEDTAFGQDMYEADYLMKQLGMALKPTGVEGLRTYWDRFVEESISPSSARRREIGSRFWFYPISPHVVVREGICVVRGLKVGVYTEVLIATTDGKPVEDVKGFKDTTGDAWANDLTERFEDLCAVHPSFNRLRGLQELVAVSKALQEMEERPDLSWWLEKYAVANAKTLKETKVLRRRYNGRRRGCELSGGVQLTALAVRLNAGDVTALRKAVLAIRPSSDALSWNFVVADWVVPIGAGQVKPEDVTSLFGQALFLNMQERHADAIALYDEILKITPRLAEAWLNKGESLRRLGRYDEAMKCFEQALEINPRLAEAWYNKGTALVMRGRWDEAIRCFDQALQINPRLAEAWSNKGVALGNLGRFDEELKCCDQALEINSRDAEVWTNKGAALGKLGRWDEAIRCFDQALQINPRLVEAWYNKGFALYNLRRYREARQPFEKAAELGFADARRALEILKRKGY